ncbi:cullin-4A [Lichtheimia hyalospora FSU 10163]|nr:cullin-4A [Lichtheimia hyalospora FSU 10163]
MPPKEKVTKKRKTTQSTLDAYRRIGPKPGIATASRPQHARQDQSHMAIDREKEKPTTLSESAHKRRSTDQIKFKNIKEPTRLTLNEPSFNDTWAQFQQLLETIFHKREPTMSLQQAYEACLTLCYCQKAEELYSKLKEELVIYIKQVAVLLEENMEADNESYLMALKDQWVNLVDGLVLVRNVFIELDRRYLIRNTKFSSLIEFGQYLFRDIVMGSEALRNTAVENLLNMIQRERDDEIMDRDLLQVLTTIFSKLDLYEQYFLPAFLQETGAYYRAESTRLLKEMDIPEYLKHVSRRIEQESVDRIQAYMEKSSRGPLTQKVIDQLVRKPLEFILQRGFNKMMDDGDKEPLCTLYMSVSGTENASHLRNAFGNYIKARGSALVQDPKRDPTMVASLLAYKAKLDDICKECFLNDDQFLNILKESFEAFVNSRPNRPAELLAKYFDSKIRSTAKRNNDEDLEDIVDKLLPIFRYLQEKDIFEAFYKRHLSKRLLLGRSISNDMEKMVLLKLKTECGPNFTKNLEQMFNDIEVSADLHVQFKNAEEYPADGGIAFRVNVLAQGIWPSYASSDVILPANMMAYQEAYNKFYTASFKGRRLLWQNSLASCVIKGFFPLGIKELHVNLLQTAVLLLFNDKSTLSYGEIAASTTIEEKDLKRILASLTSSQYQVLLKQEDGDTISLSDVFIYNDNFSSPNVRIRIGALQQEQIGEERKATEAKVLVDRQHQLEAAIVRIMKSKKSLAHGDLMKELFDQVKFPLDATDIKKRIESLIDRDYLGRSEADSNTYIYK